VVATLTGVLTVRLLFHVESVISGWRCPAQLSGRAQPSGDSKWFLACPVFPTVPMGVYL
jgi:hypothetical protein